MNIIFLNNVTRKLWAWELLVVIALILFLSSCSPNSQAVEVETATEFNNTWI